MIAFILFVVSLRKAIICISSIPLNVLDDFLHPISGEIKALNVHALINILIYVL